MSVEITLLPLLRAFSSISKWTPLAYIYVKRKKKQKKGDERNGNERKKGDKREETGTEKEGWTRERRVREGVPPAVGGRQSWF
jgi:hypothetical protein